MLLVRDAMTRDVFRVSSSREMIDVKELMQWSNIRHVPVVDPEDGLVGVITHRDLLRAMVYALTQPDLAEGRKPRLKQIDVGAMMTRGVQTARPDEPLRAAVRRMREGKLGCLPVIEAGRLVGIVTEADMMRVMEQALFLADSREPHN